MTARRTWPRSQAQHEAEAAHVLAAYIRRCGWTPALPVPVETIIERCYGLSILWEPLDELAGETILGALMPESRTIRLNELHLDLFERWVGPETFTLAHELGHWIYDAVDPNQGRLFDASGEPVFCRAPERPQGSSGGALREINANKFASCLVLPEDLLREAVPRRSPEKYADVVGALRCANAAACSPGRCVRGSSR